MDRKHFRDILKKYLQRRAKPEEEKMIDAWYAEMGRDGADIDERKLDSALEKKYWSSIHAHTRKTKVLPLTRWRLTGIAASLLLACAALFYLGFGKKEFNGVLAIREVSRDEEIEIRNSADVPQRFTLPDSSAVVLEPESRLRYKSKFNDAERTVHLSGEGFFDVSRDVHRPFLVHTGQLTTRVLGTSFRVIAIQGKKDVIVSVRTGKVSVYPSHAVAMDAKVQEVILTPNQKLVYDKSQKKLERMIVQSPEPIIPAEEVKKMRFYNAPVSDIFLAIEKVYGVDIAFDENVFSSCSLTTAISDGDIFNRLDIICNAIGARYALKEDHILIVGKGCDIP